MSERVVWGDFEVDFGALLGKGGFGAVYRGRQRSLDRPVAVKVLDTSRAPSEEFERGFLEKFEAEAKAIARIRDPRIITVYQAGRNDGRCWYAMELIDGETVDDRLSKRGMFPEAEAVRVALDVARALAAAWREGIVHRDVKPGNIFVLKDGGAKLGDFGIARSSGAPPSRLTEANALVATPTYCSPEQGMGEACDHRSDLYSLGVVLFEMVTERPPFTGDGLMELLYKHTLEAPPSPRELNPALSEGLEAVILRCLAKEPGERYPTYEALVADLEAVAAGREPGDEGRGARGGRVGAFLWITAVAGLVLFGLLLRSVHAETYRERPVVAVAPDVIVAPEPPPPAGAPPPAPSPPPAPVPEVVPLAKRLDEYRPSDSERKFMGGVRAAVRRHRPSLARRSFREAEGALSAVAGEARTEYEKLLSRGAVQVIELARWTVEARHRALAARPERARLSLKSGETMTGRIADSGEAGYRIVAEDGREAVIALDQLADGDFLGPDVPAQARLAFRACSSRAAEVLEETLAAADAEPDLRAWLPALVWLAAGDVDAAMRAGSVAEARAACGRVEGKRAELVRLLPFLEPDVEALRREGAAGAALESGQWSDVLTAYPDSAVRDLATARLLETIEERLGQDLLEKDGIMAWKLVPVEEATAAHLRLLVIEPEGFRLQDSAGLRSVELGEDPVGADPRRGLMIEFSFAPNTEASYARVVLEAPNGSKNLLCDAREIRLVDAASGATLERAAGGLATGAGSTLALVPEAGGVLVFVDGRFAFRAGGVAIPRRPSIGVFRGQLLLRSVRAAGP